MGWRCGTCAGENPEGMRFCGHCGSPAAEATRTEKAGQPTDPRPSAEADVSEALRSFVSQQVADHLVASGGDITEERRLVTALFADLSGFTPLADRLDPEELLEVIDPIIERLTNIVGRYEGYVDKFAGDALLAFFGAPVAHEDDAARALSVAMEMHEEIKNIVPELPPDAGDLTLHIGVNSGRVVARVLGTDVRMDYSVLGDAVILAQRLESAAPAGHTYVGETTRQLTENDFEFEPIGDLMLKGKTEPVPAYRLLARKRKSDRARYRGFVGREQELQTIRTALNSLAAGNGSVVSVSGEPGVGKSRLTEEVRAQVERQGGQWLVTRCLSYGQGIAYWPVAELFRRLAGIAHNDPPERALPRLQQVFDVAGLTASAPVVARVMGLPAPELEDLEPEAYRRLLHETIASSIAHISHFAPVVLVIEDLHWADASTIELILDLAKLCGDEPILLYLTARAEAVPVLVQIASGAAETHRHPIQLDPLDAPMVAPLIEGVLGGSPSATLVELINERAVGNPFFVEELVHSLQDAGDVVRTNGHWDLSPSFDALRVPPTIEGVLSARIDRLPKALATTLQVSSVIGRRVRVPLLAEVHPEQDLHAHLDGLVRAGLLDRSDEEEEVAFHHALVQDVAYARLLRKRRRQLHLRVAEEAERLYGAGDDTIDLLARHLHLAEAGEKAVEYLELAAARASELFANDEALIHLEHALELAVKHAADRQGSILIQIADLHELRGEYAAALSRYREARDLTGSVLAWRGMAAALRNQSEYEAALRVLDEAFAANVNDTGLPLLWLERGWILSRQGRFPEAIDALREGLSVSTDSPKGVIGELLVQLTRAETVVGQAHDALTHAQQAIDIFEEVGDLKGLVSAYRVSTDPYLALERLDDAVDRLKKGIQLAEKMGAAQELGACLINLGLVQLKRGVLDEAIACDERAVAEYDRLGFATGQAIAYGNLSEKLLYVGRHLEALDTAVKALDLARTIGDLETVADVTKTVAAARNVQGQPTEAALTAEKAAELYLQIGAAPTAVEALEMAVEFHKKAGDEERARATYARARSLLTSIED